MLLKAHSDMRKQEQRIKIVVKKLSELVCVGLSNFLMIIQIPSLPGMTFNNIKLLPHYCCHRKTGWFLSSSSSNNILFLSLIFTKSMNKKFSILFSWSFFPQMWKKRFSIVIYCLPSPYWWWEPFASCVFRTAFDMRDNT